MGVDIRVNNESLDITYNDLATFLACEEARYIQDKFSVVYKLTEGKGVCIETNTGRLYYFTVAQPTAGAMTPITHAVGGVVVNKYALPVATFNGKEFIDPTKTVAENNDKLFRLILDVRK